MKALVTLLIALLAGAVIVLGMPIFAERLMLGLSGPGEPTPALTEVVFSLAVFIPLGVVGIVGARVAGSSALRLGDKPGPQAALGLLLGFCGVAVAALHSLVSNCLGFGPTGSVSSVLFLMGTLLILVQVGAEEIFFRGWLQPVLVARWGAVGVGIAALAFAVLHLVNGFMQPVSFFNLFLGGLLFGLVSFRNGGIAAAVTAHFAWNWTEALLFGLIPNPGVGGFGAMLNLELSGELLWGGSEEGLNASLGMTAALLALLLLTAAARPAPNPRALAAA